MSHHRECLGTMPSAQDPAVTSRNKVTHLPGRWVDKPPHPPLPQTQDRAVGVFGGPLSWNLLIVIEHQSSWTFFPICLISLFFFKRFVFTLRVRVSGFWSLEFYLLPRAGQLLYGPITPCPAGEQEPGEEVKWKSTQEIHFSGMSCCSEVAAKSWLTANRGFFFCVCVLEAMSFCVLAVHQQFRSRTVLHSDSVV